MSRLTRIISYLAKGFLALKHKRACPACACVEGELIDQKILSRLWECRRCGLLYRFPREASDQEFDYYQNNYPGIV